MKIRKVLSVVAVAVTGLAAKAFLRRRRMVADLRKRQADLSKLLSDKNAALRSLERELTHAGNPPGSGKGSTRPTTTLAELGAMRERIGKLSSRLAELSPQAGLLAYVLVKADFRTLTAIEHDVARLPEDVESFRSRVRSARDAGDRLP